MFGFGQREVQDRFYLTTLGRPYRFVPPRHGRFIPDLLQRCLPWYMKKKYGIEHWEVRGAGRLRTSIDAGHGVVLAANHSRDSDSVGVGLVGIPAKTHLHFMAGWHVLLENWFQHFIIPRAGGFSVLREGNDRQAVRTGIDLIARASRPMFVFPEGYVSRMNDRLGVLQEGASLIARQAARQRDKAASGKVTAHPVIIKYQFLGNLEQTAKATLDRLGIKLKLPFDRALALTARLELVREEIIRVKETEITRGPLAERVPRLINALLSPLENFWEPAEHNGNTYSRVQRLRTAILNHATNTKIVGEEKSKLLRQLEDCTWALRFSSYQPEYLAESPSAERFMETLDSLEEDVFGFIRVDRPWRMVLDIGEAIPVAPRDKSLGQKLKRAMETQLGALATELNQPLT